MTGYEPIPPQGFVDHWCFWKSRGQQFIMSQFRFVWEGLMCNVQRWKEITNTTVTFLLNKPWSDAFQFLQHECSICRLFAPSQHWFDMTPDKEPDSFRNQRGCNWTHHLTLGVSTVSKGTGVSGAMGPHTLLTTSLVGVSSEQGTASLPLTIISLTTLPCWCWWRPWTNTAIWIQLEGFSALWVSVRASPWAEHERGRKL